MDAPDATVRLPVDGHVHFRPAFEAAEFLDHAAENLSAAAAGGSAGPGGSAAAGGSARPGGSAAARGWTGALLLADPAGADSLSTLRRRAADGRFGRWRLEETGERASLVATDGARRLLLVAGRQVATADGLEVLALGTASELPDGDGLHETLDRVLALGAPAVVPWGLGKWWFRRGRLLRDLLERDPPEGFLLGDNAARPAGTPEPPLFRLAAARGVAVLAGTDPLPQPEEVLRVGRYGSLLALGATASLAAPGATLRSTLRALRDSPPAIGRRLSAPAFVRSQVGFWFGRLRGEAASPSSA